MVDSPACGCSSSARFTAPVSFLGVRSFMEAVRRCPLFVAAIIPLLLAVAFSSPSPVSAAVVSTNVLASCPVLGCATPDYSMPENKTFFPVHVASDYAQFWDTFYGVNFKIIQNNNTGEQYVLYQCGTNASSLVGKVTVQSADYQRDGGIVESPQIVEIRADAKYFSIPLKKVCIRETVAMTFMELLGVRSAIYQAETKYVASSCINQLAKEGAIKDLPYGLPDANLTDCDAIIGSGNSASPNPKVITFQTTADPGMLNRAEYLDYLALFFNKEAASNDVFVPIQNRYNALSQRAKAKTPKVKTAWINSFGTFYFDKARFKADILNDAGLDRYFPANGSPNSFNSPNDVFEELFKNGIELIIDEAYNLADMAAFIKYYNISATDADPATSRYLFIKNKKVFRIDRSVSKNNADDWFESAIPNIDAVLSDFVSAGYSDLVPAGYSRTWVRNIATGEGKVTIIDTCANTAAATLPILAEGSGQAGYVCPSWLLNPASYTPPPPPTPTPAPGTNSAVRFNQFIFVSVIAIVFGTMMQLFF